MLKRFSRVFDFVAIMGLSAAAVASTFGWWQPPADVVASLSLLSAAASISYLSYRAKPHL